MADRRRRRHRSSTRRRQWRSTRARHLGRQRRRESHGGRSGGIVASRRRGRRHGSATWRRRDALAGEGRWDTELVMLIFRVDGRFSGPRGRRRSRDGRSSSSRSGLLPLVDLMRKLACVGQGRRGVESRPRRGRCSWWGGIPIDLGTRPPWSWRRWWSGSPRRRRAVDSRSGRGSRCRRRRRRRRRPHGVAVGRRRGQRRGGWRGGRRCCFALQLGLFFSQEVDNELLVVLDEVVRQSLVAQVLAEVLAPHGIKGIQEGELRTAPGVVEADRRARVVRKAR